MYCFSFLYMFAIVFDYLLVLCFILPILGQSENPQSLAAKGTNCNDYYCYYYYYH